MKGSNNHNSDFISFIIEWINTNPGKATGAFLGLLSGILIVTVGVIETLLVAILATIGFIIGKLKDDRIQIFEPLNRLLKRKKD